MDGMAYAHAGIFAPGGVGGGRAASLSSAFVVSLVSVILFTGPLAELLKKGGWELPPPRSSGVVACQSE